MTAIRTHIDFAQIASLLPDIWYCTDEDGVVVQISPRISEDFGLDLEKVEGHQIGETLSNQKAFKSLHKDTIENGRISDRVIDVIIQNNKQASISVSCFWHKNTDGTGLLIGSIRDITEREEELKFERESYLNFVDVMNSTLDGMLIVDKMTQKVIDANYKALEITGYSMEEIKSIPIGKATNADDEEMALFLELLEQNKDYRLERKIKHKKGHLIDLEISSKMMHVGEGMLFQSIIRDISQKKKLYKVEKLKEEILSIKVKGQPTDGMINRLCSQLDEIGSYSDFFYFSFEADLLGCEFSKKTNIPIFLQKACIEYGKSSNKSQEFFLQPNYNLPIADLFKALSIKKKEECPYHIWCSYPVYKEGEKPIGALVQLLKSEMPIDEEDLKSLTQLVNILGNVIQKMDQEAQLILSENRYRKLLDYSPLAIGIYADNKIAFANQEFYDILKLDINAGNTEAELISYVPEEERRSFEEMLVTIRKFGSIPIRELSLVYPDGTPFTLMFQGTSVTYKNQDAIQFVFYDISERKEFEIKLKDREILLNTTGTVAKVGGWQLMAESKILTWTDQNYVIHGKDLGTEISLDEALEFYPLSDRERIGLSIDACFEGVPFELTVKMQRNTKESLWIEYSGKPVYENGKIVKIIGAQRDITQYISQIEDIIESEQKLRSANQLAKLGNWEWSIGTDLFYWSEELYHILDVSTREIPSMELFEKLLDEESRQEFFQALQQSLDGGPSIQTELSVNLPRTGEKKYLMLQATSEIDTYGKINKVLGTIQDITDRRKMELEKETTRLYNKVLLKLEALGSRSESITELIDAYCLALVDEIDFDCVWIADHSGGIRKPVFAGMKSCKNKNTGLTKEQVQMFLESEPYRMAVSSGAMMVSELENLAMNEPWESHMKKNSLHTFIVLPFVRDGKVRGTFSLLSAKTRTVDRGMQNFLGQMIHDCGNSIYAIELKRNRDELNEYNKLLVDSLDVVSVSYDSVQDKLYVFGSTEHLVGMNKEEAITFFQKGLDSVHPNDFRKIQDAITKSKKKLGNFDVDFRVRTPDKRTVWLNAIGKIYWQGKEIRKVAGILINMDQRKLEEINQVKTHIDIRDKERIRIARELHDSLGQTLTIASMSLDAMSESIKQLSDDRQDLYHDAYQLVNDAIDETRTISHDLMPSLLMDFGLIKSIRSDIQKLNKTGKIDFIFEYDEECDQRFAQEVEVNFYNIVREGIKNILKHSQATKARIELRMIGSLLTLLIKDNGIGWGKNKSFNANGLGMSSLEGRAVSMGAECFVSGENGCEILIELELRN